MSKSLQLLFAKWVVPVVPDKCVLKDHCVVVEEGKILELLPASEAKHKYADVPEAQRWEGVNSVLLPGFVNCHTHSAMVLLRGIADDLPLMPWLQVQDHQPFANQRAYLALCHG
jgi:5-methylthioadenosine/S-adenosylhomocysteine deaminase